MDNALIELPLSCFPHIVEKFSFFVSDVLTVMNMKNTVFETQCEI
jgi:hypothetical protein